MPSLRTRNGIPDDGNHRPESPHNHFSPLDSACRDGEVRDSGAAYCRASGRKLSFADTGAPKSPIHLIIPDRPMSRLAPISRFRADLGRASLLALCVGIIPSISDAQLTDTHRARLTAQISADAETLDEDGLPNMPEAKRAVLDDMAAVDRYLTARATTENRAAWFAYLDLAPLRDAITTQATPVGTIAKESVALRFRLISTAPGLEFHEFQSLRRSVDGLIAAIIFRDPTKAMDLVSRQLKTLADRINALDEFPSSVDVAAISTILSVLESSGQAEGTIAAFRETFSRPNLAVLVRESFVQEVVRRDVDESNPVRECILGTRIVGNARMNGVVTTDLVPGVGAARVLVSLSGRVVSNNTGYNGPVRLRTFGFSDVNLSRLVSIRESGIQMEPVVVDATLRTEVRSIEHRMPLIRKIARKRVAKQKPQADRIALGRLRHRVGSQFTSQTDGAGQFTTPNMLKNARPLLQRLSLREPTYQWSSTDDSLTVDSTFRLPDQLSTVVPRPSVDAPYETAIQLHESVVNNAFAPILAGRTMSETQFDDLLKAGGLRSKESDDESVDEIEDSPFEIEFSRVQPVVFMARDQTVRIGVRGERFAQGRRELKRAMEITAIYHPATDEDGKTILVRDEEIDVTFPGGRSLTIAQAGLKPTIKRKFGVVFPKTLLTRNFEVPSTATIESLRGRVFLPILVDARDGWITVGLR